MANRWGNNGNERLYFGGLQNHCRWWLQPWNWKTLAPWKKSYDNLDSILKSRDITLPENVHLVKAMVFPVVTYGCGSWTLTSIKKASWAPKNWCFWTVVLEKTFESPLDCKEIQPVHPKGDQSWVFIGRTAAEAETPILWPPDVKDWLIGKDPDTGKDWGQEEKGTTEDEMVEWHHWLNGHEFEQAPWVGDGQGGLACCSMGLQRVRHDWWTELNWADSPISCHSLVSSQGCWPCRLQFPGLIIHWSLFSLASGKVGGKKKPQHFSPSLSALAVSLPTAASSPWTQCLPFKPSPWVSGMLPPCLPPGLKLPPAGANLRTTLCLLFGFSVFPPPI